MTQNTFNQIVTVVLFVFFMVMYVLSWLTGKTIDWNQLLVFIIPTFFNIVHQLVGGATTIANTNAQKDVQVATVVKNGVPPRP